METIAHRELRNRSAEVLRRAESGESLQITNHGRPVAFLTPVGATVLENLLAAGAARPARAEVSTLRSIRRVKADATTAEIVRDARGHW